MTDDLTLQQCIAENTADVRARIEAACVRSGRDPRDVTLVAVTKTHAASVLAAAHAAGLRDFGENRVQEAAVKVDDLVARGVKPLWHLIGNLQRNKVSAAVGRFAYIHSIDSERLATAISERARAPVRAFIEVNVAGEPSKHGVAPGEVVVLARQLQAMPNIDLVGLMTVAPIVADAEQVRPVFRHLRELCSALALTELSMGMTNDFEVAIEEGATFVRVGRAIFGERAV